MFVLPAEELKFENAIPLHANEFERLSKFIYDNYGINLPPAKKTLLESRLQKHLRISGFTSFKTYVDKICSNEEHDEVVKMINIISTNKTDFFRENSHFEFLRKEVLPAYNEQLKNKEINIWSVAASTGEEVYSIGITMEEYLRTSGSRLTYSIYGSDVSTDVLMTAREAIYQEDKIAAIPLDLKQRYFLKSKNLGDKKVRVIKKIRDKVLLKRFNMISDELPANASCDIIFCRNVLIYFDKSTQEKVIKRLCSCLKTGGYLFLGHSESLFGMNLPLKARQHASYQKVETTNYLH